MNSINFHSLKSITVPEELKESVIAIPERSGKKRSAYPVRRIRLAAAAVLAVITAVSVALFLNSGKPPVTVKSSATESHVTPTVLTVESTQLPTTVSGESTQPLATVDRPSEVSSSARQPSSKPSNASNPEPTQAPARPEAPTQLPSKPDSPPQAPTRPASPTSPPPQPPTSSPETQAPWNPYPPTEEPWNPHLPSEAILEPETEKPSVDPTMINATIHRDSLPSDRKIYCRIESPDGEVFGDFDLFDERRLMSHVGNTSDYSLYFYPFADYFDLSFESGTDWYNCYVYDSNGNILTTQVNWY